MLLLTLLALIHSPVVPSPVFCQCGPLIASVAFEDIGADHLAKVRITNISDEDICVEAGHGIRAFGVKRHGQSVPLREGIPFASLQDRCLALEPGESHIEEYTLDAGFQSLRPQDEVCFSPRVRLRADPEAPNTSITRCRIIR